jgi:hypothetical protein
MNNEGGPSFEVPSQPEVPEQQGEQVQEQAVEQQRPAAQEAGVGKRAPQPRRTSDTDVAMPDVPDATVGLPADPPTPTAPASSATAGLPAEESDLIDKQWVAQLKVIENQTRDDPHRQANEMGKAKLDYRQKRFNRMGKVGGSAST